MANRTYLLNTRELSNDCFAIWGSGQGQAVKPYVEAAEAAYRVPVAWMCCFRPEDLRPFAPTQADVYGDEEDDDGSAQAGAVAFERLMPCTTVQAAIANLEAAWPRFAALAQQADEDPEDTARSEWEEALRGLKVMPHPYLTLVVYEVVESDEDHASFLAALAPGPQSIPHLAQWSRADDDFEVALSAGFPEDFTPPVTAAAAAPRDNPHWLQLWRKLARGQPKAESEYLGHRRVALESYVRKGRTPRADYTLRHMSKGVRPALFEWEVDLDGELRSYADSLVQQVSIARARGLPLDGEAARQGFAASATANAITQHRLLLCARRGLAPTEKIDAYEIFFVALGIFAGCEEDGLRSARMLLAGLRQGHFNEFMGPVMGFCFHLLADHLGEPLPPMRADGRASPVMNTMLQAGRWRTATSAEVDRWSGDACLEYTHVSPESAFTGLPVPVMLVRKLRELRGLDNPADTAAHPLMAAAFGAQPTGLRLDAAADRWVARTRERMRADGFDEAAVHDALVAGSALPERGKPWWQFW